MHKNIFDTEYLSDAGFTFSIISENNIKLKLGCKRDGEEISKGKACPLKILFFSQNDTIQSTFKPCGSKRKPCAKEMHFAFSCL